MPFHLSDDTFTDLVAGLISPEEKREALVHIRSCANCEEVLRVRVADCERLRSVGEPHWQSDTGWQLPESEKRSTPPKENLGPSGFLQDLWTPRAVGLGSVAMAAVVLLFIFLPHRNQEPDVTLDYWLPKIEETQVHRSEASDADFAFWSAIDAYDQRDLNLAITLLRAAEVQGAYLQLRDFYLASCLLITDQTDAALTLLENFRETDIPPTWRDRCRWMRYLTLVKAERIAEATEYLETLLPLEGEIGVLARETKARRQH